MDLTRRRRHTDNRCDNDSDDEEDSNANNNIDERTNNNCGSSVVIEVAHENFRAGNCLKESTLSTCPIKSGLLAGGRGRGVVGGGGDRVAITTTASSSVDDDCLTVTEQSTIDEITVEDEADLTEDGNSCRTTATMVSSNNEAASPGLTTPSSSSHTTTTNTSNSSRGHCRHNKNPHSSMVTRYLKAFSQHCQVNEKILFRKIANKQNQIFKDALFISPNINIQIFYLYLLTGQ